MKFKFVIATLLTFLLAAQLLLAQRSGGNFGGPGGQNAKTIELVDKFDKNANGRLETNERKAALEHLESRKGSERSRRRMPRHRGPAGKPGPKVAIESVKPIENDDLYNTGVLRTVFLNFESQDWEEELAAFKPTDVEVPATMVVDGNYYKQVGVSFRGTSSFFMITAGSKRSFNISVDFADEKQRLYGVKTLNLLNCNGDASMMSSFLYHDIASKKMATPRACFVKVVVNARSWGVYANVEQFNKDFLKRNFDSKKGARWKVPGTPISDGGLRYFKNDLDAYKERYTLKSKEDDQAWYDLVDLTRVIEQTPAQDLEEALEEVLDIDGVLWFLSVDVALANSDGYWTRASDFNIYQNQKGKFHILPHDMNEAFGLAKHGGPPGASLIRMFTPRRSPGGPGGIGGNGGPKLDPLVGLDNPRYPLRSKLLANENLRKRYLQHLRTIASEYLNWDYLGPKVEEARSLIDAEVKHDTRKLMTYQAFQEATADNGKIYDFCSKRAEYLLNHVEIQNLEADPDAEVVKQD
ncbi:MAG: CotH kinase family protein [Planctomycetota bacterium]